jgi:hypothetical protein
LRFEDFFELAGSCLDLGFLSPEWYDSVGDWPVSRARLVAERSMRGWCMTMTDLSWISACMRDGPAADSWFMAGMAGPVLGSVGLAAPGSSEVLVRDGLWLRFSTFDVRKRCWPLLGLRVGLGCMEGVVGFTPVNESSLFVGWLRIRRFRLAGVVSALVSVGDMGSCCIGGMAVGDMGSY